MALGDKVSKPYVAGGSPSDSLSAVDFARTAIGGLTPMVQEVTQGRAAITGTISANGGSVSGQIMGAPSCMVQVTGTWQLDLVCQVSMDGTNWSNPLHLWEVDAFPNFRGHIQLGMNALSGAQSRNGQFRVVTEGAQYVRVFAQAAGGTPGTATVTITSSPIALSFPTQGYNVLAFDSVLPTASRTSPVFPAPPPGWRFDNAETSDAGTQTSWSGARMTANVSDNYSMTPSGATQAVTVGPIGASAYLPGENSINARQPYLSNWMTFVLGATAFSTGTVRITIWINFIPPATSPFGFGPFFADQTTAAANAVQPDVGALNAGTMPWLGAFLIATDALANTDGGKMRRLRVDSNQQLLTVAGPQSGASSGVNRKARNVNATVQNLTTFTDVLMALTIMNSSAASAFVNFYDIAGAPVVGTTVPDLEVLVPAATTLNVQLSVNGMNFFNAIKTASVTTDNGATGSAAGVHVHCVTAF